MSETQSPKLTVLAGPTAVGKGTVSAYIRDHYPEVWLSISATTRGPRPGEQDGVHYYFVSDEEFDSMVDNRQMLEWAKVHNNHRYGTMRRMVTEALGAGRHVLLEIDIQGARQVRNAMPEANMIFLAPPSWDELVRRLRTRGTETDTEQRVRLETAKEELAAEPEFDETIVNDTVEKAAAEVVKIMGIESATQRS
ncbi:guanylate kinase [uncultured Kocuria sp.]|uniref:guanylate kinase n=1 Tax=uncultured Kocuria sp. TaxID=259305 RepID=UPI002595B221|nr:guanylate kinase [uncultured Kocuria sp.]MCT1366769.1 guanylate kinase [Rothia sp. p3-SID1597]